MSLLYKGASSLVKTASGEEADSSIKTNRATVVREHLLGAGWKDFEFEIEKRAATKQAAVEAAIVAENCISREAVEKAFQTRAIRLRDLTRIKLARA